MDLSKLDFEHYIYIDTRGCMDRHWYVLTFIGDPAGFLEYAGASSDSQKELYDAMLTGGGFIKIPRDFKGVA